MQSGRLTALDGLRGVAAIAVMLDHAHVPGLSFGHGFLAVDLFFLLSGYVIAKSYEPQITSGRLGLGAYVMVRLERLYPLLFLGALVGVAAYFAGVTPVHFASRAALIRALISQFLLIPFLVMPYFFAFNWAHWSIVFELAANVVHAAALRWLSKPVLALIVIVSAGALAYAVRHFGTVALGWSWTGLVWGVPRLCFGFFGGVLLFRTHHAWQKYVPVLPLPLLALILLAITALPMAADAQVNLYAGAELAAVLIAFPLMVMAGTKAQGGAIAAALGTLSFPIYAIHKPIVEAMAPLHLSTAAEVAVVIALVLASWVIGRYVDEPLNAWRRARRKLRSGAKSATGPRQAAAA